MKGNSTMKRPNILVFMTDQQRSDSINKAIMPNVERFRKEALTFTNSYTVAPHCCPSRATFFSGLYPSQHGVWNNVKFNNTLSRGLYEGVRLFSEDLKESGYRMYFSGKWHVSVMESPKHRGFDVLHEPVPKPGKQAKYMIGDIEKVEYRHTQPPTNHWNLYNDFVQRKMEDRGEGEIIRNGYPPYVLYGNQEDIFQDDDVVADAVADLRTMEKSDEPWFYYIGTLGPHDPYYVPDKYLDMYDINDIELPKSFYDDMRDKPNMHRRVRGLFAQLSEQEHKEAIRHYLAFCTHQDELFGQVLDALEERGEVDNTIVIFMSDHGDYTAEHGLWCKGLPCFKGAYHVPTLIRWPAGIRQPGRDVDAFISLADFAPTFVDVAQAECDTAFAGKSITPFFRGETPEDWADELYTQSNGNELYGIQRSVMTPEWKYVYNGYDYDELYDLRNDPDEMVNQANNPEYQGIAKELSKKIWKFAKKNDDVCIHPYIFCGLASYGPGVIYDET